MKHLIAISIAALVAGSVSSMCAVPPDDAIAPPPGKEESIRQKARNFWIKSKGYLSEDPQTFTDGAQQTLTDLAKEIDIVAGKVDIDRPPYFETRVQSLRQQHEHLAQKLKDLTPDAIKSRTAGPRYAFDQCIGSLEKAIDQADDEADVIAKARRPEKREAK